MRRLQGGGIVPKQGIQAHDEEAEEDEGHGDPKAAREEAGRSADQLGRHQEEAGVTHGAP